MLVYEQTDLLPEIAAESEVKRAAEPTTDRVNTVFCERSEKKIVQSESGKEYNKKNQFKKTSKPGVQQSQEECEIKTQKKKPRNPWYKKLM